MKRIETQSIGSLLAGFIKEHGLARGLLAVYIYDALDKAVGERYGRMLSNRLYKERVLYCSVSSSVARTVLYNKKEEIVAQINAAIGRNVVDKLILR